MKKRLAGAAAALATVVLLLAGVARAQGTPRAVQGRAQPGVLVAPGKAPQLTVIHSGDVIGYVDPCG